MKKLILTAVLCTSLGLSAQMPGWGGPQSRVVTDSIDSQVLGAVRRYNVYLPKSFDAEPNRQYPVLYLLHGLMDTNYGWTMCGHTWEYRHSALYTALPFVSRNFTE